MRHLLRTNLHGVESLTNMQWSSLISRITTKRCQTVCLWLVVFSFCLRPLHNLFIKKWPLHILNHVSHYYLLVSSRINHYWFFRHIFPPKKRTWFERLRFLLQSFLKLKGFWYNNGYFAKKVTNRLCIAVLRIWNWLKVIRCKFVFTKVVFDSRLQLRDAWNTT